MPLPEHGGDSIFSSDSCPISFAPRACESELVFKIGWPSSALPPLNEGSAEAKVSMLWDSVIVGLLMTAEQLAMHARLLLEACTQGLAPCLFFFFFFFLRQRKQNSCICFWGGKKRTRDFANSYEWSRISPFWNLPTLTVAFSCYVNICFGYLINCQLTNCRTFYKSPLSFLEALRWQNIFSVSTIHSIFACGNWKASCFSSFAWQNSGPKIQFSI